MKFSFGNLLQKKKVFLRERKELSRYDIGEWSYGGLKVLRWRKSGNLKIGKYCSFAANTAIMLGGDHSTRNVSTFPFGVLMGGVAEDAHAVTRGDVEIGHDVWVARDSMILSGVKIGDGAVVGAASLVTRDVPSYAVVAGNPAKIVRMRFTSEQIERLLRIQWWNWNDDLVKTHAHLLLSENIEEFLSVAEHVNR